MGCWKTVAQKALIPGAARRAPNEDVDYVTVGKRIYLNPFIFWKEECGIIKIYGLSPNVPDEGETRFRHGLIGSAADRLTPNNGTGGRHKFAKIVRKFQKRRDMPCQAEADTLNAAEQVHALRARAEALGLAQDFAGAVA